MGARSLTCYPTMQKLLVIILMSCILGRNVLAENSFFPVTKDPGTTGISSFEAEWYTKALDRMDEPSLFQNAPSETSLTMRFTLLPTWGNPIAIRIHEEGKGAKLIAKRLSGQGGYDPGKLVYDEEKVLSPDEWNKIRAEYQRLNFFDLPTADPKRGHDGEEWILEGIVGSRYHLVVRWSPNEYDPRRRGTEEFVTLCSSLLDTSGLSEAATNKGHPIIKKSDNKNQDETRKKKESLPESSTRSSD